MFPVTSSPCTRVMLVELAGAVAHLPSAFHFYETVQSDKPFLPILSPLIGSDTSAGEPRVRAVKGRRRPPPHSGILHNNLFMQMATRAGAESIISGGNSISRRFGKLQLALLRSWHPNGRQPATISQPLTLTPRKCRTLHTTLRWRDYARCNLSLDNGFDEFLLVFEREVEEVLAHCKP